MPQHLATPYAIHYVPILSPILSYPLPNQVLRITPPSTHRSHYISSTTDSLSCSMTITYQLLLSNQRNPNPNSLIFLLNLLLVCSLPHSENGTHIVIPSFSFIFCNRDLCFLLNTLDSISTAILFQSITAILSLCYHSHPPLILPFPLYPFLSTKINPLWYNLCTFLFSGSFTLFNPVIQIILEIQQALWTFIQYSTSLQHLYIKLFPTNSLFQLTYYLLQDVSPD